MLGFLKRFRPKPRHRFDRPVEGRDGRWRIAGPETSWWMRLVECRCGLRAWEYENERGQYMMHFIPHPKDGPAPTRVCPN